ncbi:proton-conducting transporter membrane subunit [Streptomyces sp. NPDC005480]|uniref:complex I subunit 5 family protein n=1 Tax=Streptomyces sp. NPDC005480 TaxID=3154880 RepID=UPI0033AD0E96
MTAAQLLPLIVATPLLGAALLVAAGRRLPRFAAEVTGFIFSAGAAAWAVAVLVRAPSAGSRAVEWMGGWRPRNGVSVGIVLVGDRVGVGLAALVSVLVVAALAYSWRYFDEPPHQHAGSFPALILLFQAGMCGFVLTGDLFNAFVFFELMGVVAYALTGYRVEEARAVQGALTFGIVNSLGGYTTLLGIGLLYGRTGELGLAQIGGRLDAQPHDARPDALVLAAFVLVVTGLLIKAAAVPFQFWLPDAHAVAPTPVCLLLSGVMVELGVYGTGRVYWTVFAGPGGMPGPDVHRALLTLGVVTALVGAVMCWHQRHLKRLLAYSSVSHTGLFLIGISLLTPQGLGGTILYVLAHAGAKAGLFACTGILLDRFSSVDEHELHGQGRQLPLVGALFTVGGLALAGLPPFGTGLGKAVSEEAAGAWPTVVFVIASALTGGAVLRASARVFLGWGPRPSGDVETTTGKDEEPETRGRLRRIPDTMLAVPALLLAGALAVGVVPSLWPAVRTASDAFTDHAGYAAAALLTGAAAAPPVTPAPHWTALGVALGLLSSVLALALAWSAVRRPASDEPSRWVASLLRLQSGHLGDYVAFTLAGITLLTVLLW